MRKVIAFILGVFAAGALYPLNGLAQGYVFPDDVLPLQDDNFPERPPMLIEWGDKFFGVGELPYGVSPWKGTYWQPALWVYGNYRSGVQLQRQNKDSAWQTGQWRNRLDLLANLRLSGTERIFVGFRPLDRDGGMTGVSFVEGGDLRFSEADARSDLGWRSLKPVVYFMEGDIAELFQFLDYEDMRPLDIGFTVGRQNVFFQEGLLINDIMDVVGITYHGIQLPRSSNLRIALLWAFNEVNQAGTNDAHLLGLFTEADFHCCMMNLDVAFINGKTLDWDRMVAAYSSVQRIGFYNTSFRIAGSFTVQGNALAAPGSRHGVIVFNEISRKDYPSHNIIYFNHFVAYNAFIPASTQPPGPLGRIGVMYGGSPLGAFIPALGAPIAMDEIGASIGYQWIMRGKRRQLIAEMGLRQGVFNGNNQRVFGPGVQLQQALGNRYVFDIMGFAAYQKGEGVRLGTRFGFLVKM